jgi:hypothetical protein
LQDVPTSTKAEDAFTATATVRVSVRFRAPDYPCTTMSRWKMVDREGAICMPGLTGIWCLVTVTAI